MNKDSAETEKIMLHTGAPPVSCDCTKCADMCRKTPCLGTPADILQLIESGYIDKMGSVYWGAGLLHGIGIIPMIQLLKNDDNSCIMFKDGLCSLHTLGLKPTEGVLVRHDTRPLPHKLHLTVAVALTWLAEHNYQTITAIVERLIAYEKKLKEDGATNL